MYQQIMKRVRIRTTRCTNALPHQVFQGARRPKCHDWCLVKQKINVAGQGQPRHLNIQPHAVPCLKTQHIGSEVYSERVILQVMPCIGSLAGVTYLRYTVLMSSNKSETAVHCCDPALSVLVMLVSRNVFHVVSALRSIVYQQHTNPVICQQRNYQ